MSDIDEVLGTYDYAETITRAVAEGKISVTLAEANPGRNPKWTLLTYAVMKSENVEDHRMISEDAKIAIFCAALLKSWTATQDGKPIEPKEAAEIFKSGRKGRLLFREIFSLCLQPDLFFQGEAKKKPSSTSSPNAKSSGKKPKTSRSKPKPAAAKSPTASKST